MPYLHTEHERSSTLSFSADSHSCGVIVVFYATEDVIDIILSVLITLFENTMSRVQIKKIETKPPNIVPYSGYFLQRKNSIEQKTSHFLNPYRISFIIFILFLLQLIYYYLKLLLCIKIDIRSYHLYNQNSLFIIFFYFY